MLHVLVRETHDVLYELPVTTIENTYAEIPVSGVHACPGLLGGIDWNSPAYDSKSDTLFVSSFDRCATFKKSATPAQYAQDAHYYGGTATPDFKDPTPEASCSGFGENENYG
jgi:alcohol dehydrogenase (cytochrome c)